jgi:hypothetical protein
VRRRVAFVALGLAFSLLASSTAHAEPEIWSDEGVDGGQSSTEISAHDQNRVADHRGTVGVTTRQTAEPKCNEFGQCEVAIRYSECLAEMDDQGISPTTTPVTADPSDTYTYTTVCFNSLPEERVGVRDPQDEADVVAWAKDYFRRTALPTPAPEMSAPNGGICGVVHTANLHMPLEVVHEESSTPFGSMRLHVYGTVHADWGDGKRSTYRTSGGPYPSAIAHSWPDRGFYNINFRTDWVATYTLGPYNGFTYTGVLSGVSTQGSVPNFRVWEAQAMRIK